MNLPLNENASNICNFTCLEAKDFILTSIKKNLMDDILDLGQATLILTGGKTIQHFLPSIADLDIPWEKITISLTDDRLVSTESKYSNEGFLLRNFLNAQGPSKASFISLKETYFQSKNHGHEFLQRISPLSLILMSMGSDGHVASLFPEDKAALSSSDPIILTERKDFKRVSLSIPLLLKAKKRYILVAGRHKCEFLDSINFMQFPLSKIFKESHILKMIDFDLTP